jgi:hypothetical protein
LEVATIGSAWLQTECFELGSNVMSSDLLAARSRTAPFQKVVGEEAHVGPQRRLVEMVHGALDVSRDARLLRAGNCQKQARE